MTQNHKTSIWLPICFILVITLLKTIPVTADHIPELNALMYISKIYWGYEDMFLAKFMEVEYANIYLLLHSITQKNLFYFLIAENYFSLFNSGLDYLPLRLFITG